MLKDTIPPHNEDAERALLGAILLKWSIFGDVARIIKSEHFYNQNHQVIFKAMGELSLQNVTGDIVSLITQLTKTDSLTAAGGASYISGLTNSVPTSANYEYYANIVYEHSVRRSLINISGEIKASSFDESRDYRLILSEAEQKIFELGNSKQSSAIYGMKELVSQAINDIDEHYKNKESISGIASGIKELDTMTFGFQKSDMIIIGARPSMGKSALALSMVENIAINNRISCGFFSLEMPKSQVAIRLISQVARIPSKKLKTGMLTLQDFKKLQDAAGLCYDAPFHLCDTPNMKLLDLKSMARQMKEKHDVKIIFIDYIGLIGPENPDAPVYEQQSAISKALKSLARELDIPIVVLCQLTRNAEGTEPNLAQLRGSGSIEQDADVVMFINGERPKEKEEEQPQVMDRSIMIAKHRNGSIGSIDVAFISSYTKFESKSRDRG